MEKIIKMLVDGERRENLASFGELVSLLTSLSVCLSLSVELVLDLSICLTTVQLNRYLFHPE